MLVWVRGERLVSLLLLLQLGRRWTAAELAGRLGVSVRTVHRDIMDLAGAGVPVLAERGPGGGFAIPPGYRTQLPLTASEAQALLAGSPGAAEGLGVGDLLPAARLKLLGSLRPELRRVAAQTGELFHVDEQKWFSGADPPPVLTELARAALARLRARIEYREHAVAEPVEPLGLVLKAGVWYLAARAHGRVRVYRVSRVTGAQVTGERFERPAGFDLVSFWERSRSEFETSRPQVDIVVRADPAGVAALRSAVDWSVRPALDHPVAAPPDGRSEFRLPYENADYAYADLARLGGAVEVMDPPSLRDRLARTGWELVSLYGGRAVAADQ